ncbi:selenocysteine-specific elongation factor [Microlunatus sagamiharensis]|uniref:Selenocysteine-specific elongation factor n=1 Tax=Microlunatus sagamiharensis TaxID=546874 RepID=A0A1H2LK94_9ACTN|nr:selenocysteine-specific translation elongation factor [Microlunatus sagamiharensis]SDU81349.1 selenocysteine-specific elongation factor [Microlunatus sagamiharensis]
MHVVATAGHVDHGKSTLVRALTGMEPDRFAEEKRRGMTIDLGYAWTRVSEGAASTDLAFVDVPGHERFIASMLAGLGPAPAVMFVVAADEGWRRQSEEHLAAVDALGLTTGLLVVTRSDLADPAAATAEARARIARSSLGDVPAVAVSGATGAGLPRLRQALLDLVATLPTPRTDGRVRLWVDRAFTIRGAGTVVTGTLGGGTLRVGDTLALGGRTVSVRGLQSLGSDATAVPAVARVAVNLRGVDVDQVGRGDALLSPGAWSTTDLLDVRVRPHDPDAGATDLPAELVAHLGTAAVPVRLRPLDGEMVRLTLHHPLAVEPGDRLVLRDPGRHAVAAGAVVLDTAPPALSRRGAAAARARDLAHADDHAAVLADRVRRAGAVRAADLATEGVPTTDPSRVRTVGDWLVDPPTWERWAADLATAVDAQAARTPLDPRLTADAARRHLGLPDRSLLAPLAEAAGLAYAEGRVGRPGADRDLGPAEAGMARLEAHLAAAPFAAPERPELEAWGLGVAELAAAERVGRVVRLAPDMVLLPDGPARAMRVLAALPQPFTTSEARLALATTRRVAIPLLEHLDRRGWTVRQDAGHRRVKGR